METFNLAQLTKEMVVHQLRNLKDPALVAGEVIRGTLIARLKGHRLSNYEIQEAVVAVCRGAVSGMVLMEVPLPRGLAAAFIAARQAGKAADIEPNLVDIAAIKGLSAVQRFANPETLHMAALSLNRVRLGAKELFERYCGQRHTDQSHPAYIPPK